jgi:hypothetical protein
VIPSRRSFLIGAAALIAAPAVVRASSLMPVRGIVQPVMPEPQVWTFYERRYVWATEQGAVHFSAMGDECPWGIDLFRSRTLHLESSP